MAKTSLGGLWSGAALAQTSATRTSSFAYDPDTGLLTQEVVELDDPALRLQTDHTHDAFRNKLAFTLTSNGKICGGGGGRGRGGGGGGAGNSSKGGSGGPGLPGGAGTMLNASTCALNPPPAGGAAGPAVIGNSFITWAVVGDRKGPLD